MKDLPTDEPHDARALTRALARAGRRLEAAERDALADFGLSPATFRLLDLVAREGGTSPTQAAARLDVRQPTVTGWLNALRERGLVDRDAVADDGRRARLVISEHGREVHEEAADLVRRRQARLLAVLDPVAQADLLAALRRVGAESEETDDASSQAR